MSSFSVHCSPTLSEALRNMDNILFKWPCCPQDRKTPDRKPVEQHPFTCRWLGRRWWWLMSTGGKDWRTYHLSLPGPSVYHFLRHIFILSHVVVLVGVLLVALHIVPVDKRLYPLLQVSRLKGGERQQRFILVSLLLFIFTSREVNNTEKRICVTSSGWRGAQKPSLIWLIKLIHL